MEARIFSKKMDESFDIFQMMEVYKIHLFLHPATPMVMIMTVPGGREQSSTLFGGTEKSFTFRQKRLETNFPPYLAEMNILPSARNQQNLVELRWRKFILLCQVRWKIALLCQMVDFSLRFLSSTNVVKECPHPPWETKEY